MAGGSSGRAVFLVVAISLIANLVLDHLYTKLPTHIDGTVEPKYEDVKSLFTKNFLDGWERDGASLVVYRDGKKVVDLWGGYADRSAARKWSEDTISVAFSTTKAVAALCVALLVDRGRLKYDDLITKHWPGFGKHGKDNVTVQMALSHMAGLAYLDEVITEEIAKDHEQIRVIFENEKPKWPPGTLTGYHVYTYGWLVDQIIRHVDEKKRSVGTFFREEIAEPRGIDFHIGLPAAEEWRVARLSLPSLLDRLSELVTDFRVYKYFLALYKILTDTPLARAANNPSWLQAVAKLTMNNPDYHRIEQAAALGIGNARSLAKLFDLVATEKLFSSAVNAQLQKHYVNETDIVMGDKLGKGNGLLYFPVRRAGTEFAIGHSGHGCQQVQYDVKNRLTIAYMSNGLKTGLVHLCRTYARLEDTVYKVLEKEQIVEKKKAKKN